MTTIFNRTSKMTYMIANGLFMYVTTPKSQVVFAKDLTNPAPSKNADKIIKLFKRG